MGHVEDLDDACAAFADHAALTFSAASPGEDGPTHQPVETLDALRAVPNLHTWRPADRTETKAAYVSGMKEQRTPTVISLSRQNTPYIAGTPHCVGWGSHSRAVHVWQGGTPSQYSLCCFARYPAH